MLQLTNDLLKESEDEAIRSFQRDIILIREYFESVIAGDLVYGKKYEFRQSLSEKHNTSIKTVEAALFGLKRKKVRSDIIREIKNEHNDKKRHGRSTEGNRVLKKN